MVIVDRAVVTVPMGGKIACLGCARDVCLWCISMQFDCLWCFGNTFSMHDCLWCIGDTFRCIIVFDVFQTLCDAWLYMMYIEDTFWCMIVYDVLETLFDALTQMNLSYANKNQIKSGEPLLCLPILFSALVWHWVPQSSVPQVTPILISAMCH